MEYQTLLRGREETWLGSERDSALDLVSLKGGSTFLLHGIQVWLERLAACAERSTKKLSLGLSDPAPPKNAGSDPGPCVGGGRTGMAVAVMGQGEAASRKRDPAETPRRRPEDSSGTAGSRGLGVV